MLCLYAHAAISECHANGSVRLYQDKPTMENMGTVEVCYGGYWGSVCSVSWDNFDAQVICKYLGFGEDGKLSFVFCFF